jgi:hypothetical protein
VRSILATRWTMQLRKSGGWRRYGRQTSLRDLVPRYSAAETSRGLDVALPRPAVVPARERRRQRSGRRSDAGRTYAEWSATWRIMEWALQHRDALASMRRAALVVDSQAYMRCSRAIRPFTTGRGRRSGRRASIGQPVISGPSGTRAPAPTRLRCRAPLRPRRRSATPGRHRRSRARKR